MTDVAWNGEVFVAVGSESVHLPLAAIFISDDGRNWRSLAGDDVPHFFYRSVAWGNGVFVVGGSPENSPSRVIMVTENVIVGVGWTHQAAVVASKQDGQDWVYQEFPARGRNFSSVIWTGDRFLVAGYLFDGVLLASFDGLTWFTQEVGIPMSIRWFESNGESTVGIGKAYNTNSIVSLGGRSHLGRQ